MSNLPTSVATPRRPVSLPNGTSGRNARTIIIQMARAAGKLAANHLYADKVIHYKGKADLVTDVDVSVQASIIETISREFPEHAVLGEEGLTELKPAEYLWIIDPIDGTLNYAKDIGFFCICIALAKGEDLILSAIVDPLRRELFIAQRGRGASRNGRPIVVGDRQSLEQATFGFDLGYDEEGRRRVFHDAVELRPLIQTFRVLGSSALGLSYVACGRLDAYTHRSLYPWDLAAARLLVEEAGGRITDREGEPCTLYSRTVLAANPELHRLLLSKLPK